MRSRLRQWIGVTGTALAICGTGCATSAIAPSAAAPAGIDFMRGCWVEKTSPGGPVNAFLRRLPDRGDGATLAGTIQGVRREADGPAVNVRATLAFTLDGRRADIVLPDGLHASLAAQEQARVGEAAFAAEGLRLRVSALPGDRLHIAFTNRDNVEGDLFHGERDGCD